MNERYKGIIIMYESGKDEFQKTHKPNLESLLKDYAGLLKVDEIYSSGKVIVTVKYTGPQDNYLVDSLRNTIKSLETDEHVLSVEDIKEIRTS